MESDANLDHESKRRSADFESLAVSAKTQGCFHFEQIEITITIEGKSAVLSVQTSSDNSGKNHPSEITLKHARPLIDEFLNTIATPQKLAGDNSTTVYRVEVFWTKGGSMSKWNFKSSEMPIECVLEILPKLEPQKQASIRQSHKDYFNAAHEVYKLCQRVAQEAKE